MNEYIIGENVGQVDTKRFYIPGVMLGATCPDCKSEVFQDFHGNDYLINPVMGVPIERTIYCEHCYHEWTCKIIVKIDVKVVT